VQNIDHRKATDERTIWRGEKVQATVPLLLAVKAATHGWTGRPVHFGTVLSGNILVSYSSYLFPADSRIGWVS
jgi:hypothetical protein